MSAVPEVNRGGQIGTQLPTEKRDPTLQGNQKMRMK